MNGLSKSAEKNNWTTERCAGLPIPTGIPAKPVPAGMSRAL